MTQDSQRVRKIERKSERGSTLILTALVMPVLVLFAGLGVGGAVVRSSADETQRTANLTAAAAAAQVPTLGRPTYAGVPTIPDGYQMPLPPAVPFDDNVTFSPNSVYQTELDTSTEIDREIAVQAGAGPLFTSALGAIGAPWDTGCKVGEAQYQQRRARMSDNFARSPGLTPKCPVVSGGTVTYPNNAYERIYVRPEMESTGAYRLQLCFVNPVNCTLFFGKGAEAVLNEMGQEYGTQLPALDEGCVLDPAETGCLFDSNTLQNSLDQGAAQAQAVEDAVEAAFNNAVGPIPDDLKEPLQQLGGLLFGRLNLTEACTMPLGPASGQQLCQPGVNLASILPSTMTPRVRSIVHHSVDIPLVPEWANGSDPGDFDFTGHALARRTFKNAVVVPTLPASFGVQQGVCLKGATLLDGLPTALPVSLGTLAALVNGAGLPALPVSLSGDCPNVEVDHAHQVTDPVTGEAVKPIDLNPALLNAQEELLSVAADMNKSANRAVNARLAAALNAEDGGTRKWQDCSTDPTVNPPNGEVAPWCVDMGGQMIEDVQDVYDPPGDGSAPTAQEVLKGAAESGEPVEFMGLMKQVPVELDPPVRMPNGTTVSRLTYFIPALDFVPALVTCFFDAEANVYIRPPGSSVTGADLPCDAEKPFTSTFKLLSDASGPKGLYRAVLMHPGVQPQLCDPATTPVAHDGRCLDQPKAGVTLPWTPPVSLPDPPTTTTTINLPVTTTTTVPITLPPTTLPITIPPTTIQILPLPTTTPTLPKIGL